MQLTITVATRGRPDRLLNTVERTLRVMAEPNTQMVIAIDEDDEATQDIANKLEMDPRIIVDSRPREDAIGHKWDRGIQYGGDVFFPQADYTAYITPAFDTKILEAASLFPDGIGVTYTRMANASFPRSQGATRALVDLLGFMYPPYFPYWFVDHWLHDIAQLIDRISFADVDVDPGPAKLPTQEMREVPWWATFFDSQRLVRRAQARAIIDSPVFKEPKWRKELLRHHYPLIEFRSQCINDTVRSMRWPAALPGGPRYDRLRARAAEMMRAEWPAMEREMRAHG